MDIYLEFISNHTLLFIAFFIIVFLLLQSVFSDLTRKYKLLSATEAINLINREGAVVIDARTLDEFNDGHISDAIHIPVSDIENRAEKLKKHEGKPIIFYCKTGSRSNDACKALNKLNFDNVYSLSGGIQSWLDANMPLSKQ